MKRIIILLMIVTCFTLCSCSMKKDKQKQTTRDNFEGIDISLLNEDEIDVSPGELDMDNSDVSIEGLSERADVIIKGKLIKLDSNVSEQTGTIYTDYTFKVEKVYRGNISNKFTINVLGGIMKYDKYIEQLIDMRFAREEDKYNKNRGKYVSFEPEGFQPLTPKGDYIIYASYNDVKECYYPTGYFYGIFNSKDGTEEYKRYTLDTDNEDDSMEISEVEKNLNN